MPETSVSGESKRCLLCYNSLFFIVLLCHLPLADFISRGQNWIMFLWSDIFLVVSKCLVKHCQTFLTHMVEEPMRTDIVLDLVLTKKDWLGMAMLGRPWMQQLWVGAQDLLTWKKQGKLTFKHHFLKAQNWCRVRNKTKVAGDLHEWTRSLWKTLNGKKKIYGMWKRGLSTWEEYINTVKVYREAVRKAKGHLN